MRNNCLVAVAHLVPWACRRDASFRLRPPHRRPILLSPLLLQTAVLLVSNSPSAHTVSRSSNTVLDAQFEVLGSPFSLLSASISASQNLYTRKGSLVGFHGNAESVSMSAVLFTVHRYSLSISDRVLAFRPRTLPPRRIRHSFPLPKSHFDRSLHSLDLVKVSSLHLLRYPP